MQWKNSVAVLCLAVSPALALAGPEAGDRLFTLTGSGASDSDFDNNTSSVSFDLGKFYSDRTLLVFAKVLALRTAKMILVGAAQPGCSPTIILMRVTGSHLLVQTLAASMETVSMRPSLLGQKPA
ncbi:hypothetical protein ATG98_3277 [Marinobacter sp. LV10R520-4]|nr:hypothetical protein ATG98_3277 [Marinobacter sp. LV10R520-4]